MKIREILEERNIKQKDVASAIGIYTSTMSQYVTGVREPDIETLIKLADYFGVSVDYLIGHDSPPGDASPTVRNFIYLNDKKYELKQNALKMQINGVSVNVTFEE